jgi:PAS domain S-box-containing protein
MKILVVDDDLQMRALTSAVLASGGHEVTEASTGKEALEAVAAAHPDLVVLDVVLSDISGFDVCKQIKSDSRLRSTFVALYSGLSTSSEAQIAGLDIGADAFIVKGIPNDELLARVNSLARMKKAEDALKRANDELDQRVKERTAELAAANQRLVASEKDLLERLRFERLLSDIAARLVNAAPAELDPKIQNALAAIVDFFRVTQCVLTKGRPEEKKAIITHAAHVPTNLPAAGGMDVVQLFPWTSEMLLRNRVVRVKTLEELPVEAAADKDAYSKLGIRSILSIPLSFEGSIYYAISIASIDEEHAWPEEYIPRLRLIGEIVVNAIERTKARGELEEKLRFETLLADLSGRFLALAADRVDREIEEAQRHVCELLGLDRSTLWQLQETGPKIRLLLTHMYDCSETPLPTELDGKDHFPWATQKVLSGETLVVSKMEDLPQEATRDRDTWRHYVTKSSLVVPLLAGGRILGAVSFARTQEEMEWPETVVQYLRLIAQVFANALSRKSSDDALRKSEQRLKLAADSANIGLWSVDIASNYLWNSESSYRLLGVDRDVDLTEEVFFSRVHPEDLEKVRKVMAGAVSGATEVVVEYRIIRPDGNVRWLITRARPYFTPSGEPERLAGMSIDMTERKQMEGKIREAAEEWQRTFDSVKDYIMVLDRDYRVIRANASVLSFLGLPLDRIVGKHCYSVMHESDKPDELCPLKTMLRTKQHEDVEVHDKKINSWFNVSVSPIFDNQGQITRIVHTVRDLTQHKKAEAEAFNARRELLRTERLLRMGELTASLAHELNQPLASILSNSRAALRFLDADRLETDQLREILEDIARDDKRAGDIIRSLRSMIKPEDGEQELFSVKDVLDEASSLFHSEAIIRNVTVETDCAYQLPQLMVNKTQILQVLINLMMNAAESMVDSSEGGRIILQARLTDGDAVLVGVRDFGPGVQEEDMRKLFEPFFTTKRSGLGMGLSLSRSIIEAHGGHIRAENNPDKGATFYFDLPGAKRG